MPESTSLPVSTEPHDSLENPQASEAPQLAPLDAPEVAHRRSWWDLGLDRSPSRSIALDFLRGVAALMVLLHHTVVAPSDAGIWKPFARLWEKIGWMGVDLFFVLSGFLVGGLLFKEIKRSGKLDAWRFLIRRGLKIWPAYYVFLLLASLLDWLDPFGLHTDVSLVRFNLLHLQNYLGTPFGITWSLAVEEHFYLALPLLLLGLLRFEKAPRERLVYVPFLVLGIAVLCLGLRIAQPPTHLFIASVRTFPTHLRVDSLMWGVFLASIFHYAPARWNALARQRWLWLVVGIVLLAPALVIAREKRFIYTIGYSLFYLGFGALLLSCVGPTEPVSHSRVWRFGPLRLVAAVGFYSYGVYLWHNDIVKHFWIWFWAKPFAPHIPGVLHYPLATVLYLSSAVALGIGMTRLIEVPFLRWRDRIFPPKDGRVIERA